MCTIFGLRYYKNAWFSCSIGTCLRIRKFSIKKKKERMVFDLSIHPSLCLYNIFPYINCLMTEYYTVWFLSWFRDKQFSVRRIYTLFIPEINILFNFLSFHSMFFHSLFCRNRVIFFLFYVFQDLLNLKWNDFRRGLFS